MNEKYGMILLMLYFVMLLGVNIVKSLPEKAILSEKFEDNKAAVEWGIKEAELIKKGEDITQRLMKKYKSIIISRDEKELSK